MKKLLLTAAMAVFAFPAMAADEVIVSERYYPGLTIFGFPVNIQGTRLDTQVLDIATESAAFDTEANYILICNNAGAAIWYKIGASGVSATANTDDNEYLPSATCREEPLGSADTNIDTAADS